MISIFRNSRSTLSRMAGYGTVFLSELECSRNHLKKLRFSLPETSDPFWGVLILCH